MCIFFLHPIVLSKVTNEIRAKYKKKKIHLQYTGDVRVLFIDYERYVRVYTYRTLRVSPIPGTTTRTFITLYLAPYFFVERNIHSNDVCYV